MNPILIAVICLAAMAVLAWNFIPPVRERMRGWTTMAEAALAGALPLAGELIDAFADTDWKSFVPLTAWPYIMGGLAAWFIYKRVVTSTPVGEGK